MSDQWTAGKYYVGFDDADGPARSALVVIRDDGGGHRTVMFEAMGEQADALNLAFGAFTRLQGELAEARGDHAVQRAAYDAEVARLRRETAFLLRRAKEQDAIVASLTSQRSSDISTTRAMAHAHLGACEGEHTKTCDMLTIEFAALLQQVNRGETLLGRWMFWASGVAFRSEEGEQIIADTDAALAGSPIGAPLAGKETTDE